MKTTVLRMAVLALAFLAVVENTVKAEEKKEEEKEKLSAIAADVVKVEIQRAPNRKKGRMKEDFIAIEDKKKIAELLAFFPKLGERSGERRVLWVADYHIKCIRTKEDPFYIRVSWDLKWWGDVLMPGSHWPLKNPDKFEKLVDGWIKKK